MTIDKEKLKALAKAANAVTTDVNITMAVGADPEEVKAVQDYLQQTMPKNVLGPARGDRAAGDGQPKPEG